MLSTALGFAKDRRVTDHQSILATEGVGFSKCCCRHELKENTELMLKLSLIGL